MIDFSNYYSSVSIQRDLDFYNEVIQGLLAPQKYIHSKYFYDAAGDRIFQEIMKCPEYYLTVCEREILHEQRHSIATVINSYGKSFDVIELGPGDASKSSILLKELVVREITDAYFPIDISGNVIRQLERNLPLEIHGLAVNGLHGDYMNRLRETRLITKNRGLVLFMGASIGNFTLNEAREFCLNLKHELNPGDLLMVGFDLKKDPEVILNAYNDKSGITRAFNLNLLTRINRELDADFDMEKFDHSPTYDPISGACQSYLVSKENQVVIIGEEVILFSKSESIYTEISLKYTVDQVNDLALSSGFKPIRNFFDKREWFVDALWMRK